MRIIVEKREEGTHSSRKMVNEKGRLEKEMKKNYSITERNIHPNVEMQLYITGIKNTKESHFNGNSSQTASVHSLFMKMNFVFICDRKKSLTKLTVAVMWRIKTRPFV
jgi:hypothetical protein